ncbi:MAG TPA: hypothetical protein VFE58_03715 [Tepidisphaeraceae bacterium]|jgi:hypothetical protein|nr:hypothetical protein [Tepidisphaeraceae bacterium]
MGSTYQAEQEEGSPHLQAVAGIEGLRVTISQIESSALEFGMNARELTLFIQGMLRLAKVDVVRHDDAADVPTLRTTIAAKRVIDVYSISLSVELWDRVWLTRQTHGHAIQAVTWRRSASLVSNRHELRHNMRVELGHLLTHFMNDYTAANRLLENGAFR